MSERAYITPKVFKWARESAKMPIDVAASKVNVTVERLSEWEAGESFPTIKQAQNLAKAYKRPFALLFLPDIPNDFQPLQDFRKKGSKELSTASIFIVREIQQKQAWISDLYEEDGEEKLPFIGKFSIYDDPIEVAEDLVRALEINPMHYNHSNPILEWIDRAESKGIFISRTSFIHSRLKIALDEIQGFAIADTHAPFIFINSEDWNAPQLFTLVHELAHLWIAKSGISNDVEPSLNDRSKYNPIELFCNEVAANALMPLNRMERLDSNVFNSPSALFKQAKEIGISSFALLVRALNLNLISHSKYKQLKTQAEIEFRAFLKREEAKKALQKKKDNSGPSYYLLQLNRNSRLFTQRVLDAFHGGVIAATLASNLLNVQVNKFPKLEAQMYR